MKDKSTLYRMIRRSRLQNKYSNPRTHLALETLVETAISLQNLEVAHDIADIPNLMQVEKVLEGHE